MSSDRVNFKNLKSWLSTLKTDEEVLAEKDKFFEKHKNLTEKQVNAIKSIFRDRRDWLDAESRGEEFWDDKEHARLEGWIIY